MLRSTSVGLYHINKLCTFFTYIDAIIVDIPIIDNDFRRQIKLVQTLPDRMNRVELVKSYLTHCWAAVPGQTSGFDWMRVAQELETDMAKVLENSKKDRGD